jgi:MFS family permease
MLAVVTPLPVAMLILFVYGLNASTGVVVFNSTIQDAVPETVRGRVFTLLDIVWNAMRLLSLGLGGVLADLVGIQWVFWAGGLLLTVAGMLGLTLMPRRRPIRNAAHDGAGLT